MLENLAQIKNVLELVKPIAELAHIVVLLIALLVVVYHQYLVV